jgi:hypothetical protein
MYEKKDILLQERNFKVNYEQIGETLWRASSELSDEMHHIKTRLDIRVPAMLVEDAAVEFVRMPLGECGSVCRKAEKLIGTKVKDLGFKLFRTFLGSNGCSQLYLLFGLSGPGFSNIYELNRVKQGETSRDEYNTQMKKDCLAHKELSRKKA